MSKQKSFHAETPRNNIVTVLTSFVKFSISPVHNTSGAKR